MRQFDSVALLLQYSDTTVHFLLLQWLQRQSEQLRHAHRMQRFLPFIRQVTTSLFRLRIFVKFDTFCSVQGWRCRFHRSEYANSGRVQYRSTKQLPYELRLHLRLTYYGIRVLRGHRYGSDSAQLDSLRLPNYHSLLYRRLSGW